MTSTRKLILVITLLIFTFMARPALARDQVVGKLEIKETDNVVLVTATLNKTVLAYAVNREGDCSTIDKMQHCGNDYFMKHLHVEINSVTVKFEMSDMEVRQNDVVITYQEKTFTSKIQSVKVACNYFHEYNHLAATKVMIDINEKKRSFNLDRETISVQASFKPAS